MAELVDAHDSKSCSFGSEGSIPSFGTELKAVLARIALAFGCTGNQGFPVVTQIS